MIALDFELIQGSFTLDIHVRLEGRAVAIFGPSGAGKTTILDTIAGLRAPRHGSIRTNERILYSSTDGIDLAPRDRHVASACFAVASMAASDFRTWLRSVVYQKSGSDAFR